MSTGFNWFKSYNITEEKYGYGYDEFHLHYIGGGDTSHSAGNIGKCQDLLEKYGNIRIPSVCEDFIPSEDYKLELVEPSVMSDVCAKILLGREVDVVDMRDRIEWFKQLSDEGYYLTYDYE